jgi:hypothetical protein
MSSSCLKKWLLNNPCLPQWDDHSIVSHLSFPDSALTSSLISLYFSNVNAFIPVLHRPIFEEAVSQGLHMLQDDFASTLLLVCALGSLYLADSSMYNQDRRKLAWNFYNQVELCGHSLRRQPTTYDLQAYCVRIASIHHGLDNQPVIAASRSLFDLCLQSACELVDSWFWTASSTGYWWTSPQRQGLNNQHRGGT